MFTVGPNKSPGEPGLFKIRIFAFFIYAARPRIDTTFAGFPLTTA
jgi:hypothetical protein